jgi:hypothetical protein
VALVRVYCGLASADDSVRAASAAQLTIAVVDDAGRLLGVHEISDDPSGYAELGSLLVARTSGFTDAAVAADSDDHVVTSLLTAAGRPLVVADDDSTDDFAERFADDDSVEEIQAPRAARRAVGLARALQAGAIAAVNLQTPRELVSYKPILAAHVALLNGRYGTAVALRETLRELYPAALRAYPDPAHPLAMAVLDAIPEPSRLSIGGVEAERVAEQLVSDLARAQAGTEDEIIAAVTALSVAISESPRRGGVNKSLAPAAAKSIRQAIAAVRACDAACSELMSTLADRTPLGAGQSVTRRGRRAAEPAAPLQAVPGTDNERFGSRRSRPEPAATGSGPVIPQPLNAPPAAPEPTMPPPLAPRPVTPPPAAPAASAAFPNRTPAPGNRPVSVPPPPPGMTPITPGSRPPARTPNPAAPTSAPSAPAASAGTPADNGEPFRATLTSAAINTARAERRTVIPSRPTTPASRPSSPAASGGPTDYPRPSSLAGAGSATDYPRPSSPASATDYPRPSSPAAAGSPTDYPRPSSPAATGSATDYSLPMPAQRPGHETAEPGSRANWPLLNSGDDPASTPAASISSPPVDNGRNGRVKPPWQDMPKEPPALRLVEPQLGDSLDATMADLPAFSEPPSLRVVDGEGSRGRVRRSAPAPTMSSSTGSTLTALDRSTTPPVPAESSDGDLLIFAAARSAWFTGHTDVAADLDWANPNDSGWRAAEKAATPAVAAETAAGLPKRVPQANLVPGSPHLEERPLRIVRDAASIAAHTTGYFRGWRRGQEIGGFAMGGRPGREAAGGWDFTRDGQPADDYRNSEAGYRR